MRPNVLIGGVLAGAGLAMMAGWVFQLPAIVRVFPGFLMVFDTALGFAIAGGALAAGAFAPALRRSVHSGAGLVLAALGALVLAQYAFDLRLGIDWPALHAWLPDPRHNPNPGRMSAATGAGFFLAGAAFMIVPRVRGTAGVLLVRYLTAGIAAIGLTAAVGQALNLADILDFYWLNQVSLPTALSFLLLALGLWFDWRGDAWNALRLIRAEDDRIALAGALLLAVCIAATGASILWIMLAHAEQSYAAELKFALQGRRALVERAIERAIEQTAELASRPTVLRNYPDPSGTPVAAKELTPLPAIAGIALRSGFSAIVFRDAAGREIASAGEFIAASDLHIPLLQAHAVRGAELLWDGNFLLQMRADIVKAGVRVGELRSQHRLADLRGVMTDVAERGTSAEFGLCGWRAGKLHCAPTRFQPRVFDVPAVTGGERLPMSYAMEGGTGVLKLTDYRAKRVLAAYAPMWAPDIGLVLKIDLDDLYAPIRERLGYFAWTLLLTCIAGGLALRLRVHPLVHRLLLGKERLRMALEGSRLAMWDWNIRAGRVALSEQWSAMLGGVPQASEAGAAELQAMVHPEDAAGVRELVRSMLAGTISHYVAEHRVRTHAGEWKWILSRGRVVQRARDGSALRAIGTNTDINERKLHELEATHRAAHDVLTGLPNRGMFHDRLDQAILRGKRGGKLMAVMYLDADRFKAVNDTLGHAAGDALLKDFARRLSGCVRSVDTVARFGGDEFAVILEGLAARDDGLRVAADIVAAMRVPFVLEGHAASISASVGIAFRGAGDQTSAAELLKSADAALYEAKKAGRDRYCVAAETTQDELAHEETT